MFDTNIGLRPVGVGIPAGQLSTGVGLPRTVTGFVELRTIGFEYVDEQGNKHRTIGHVDEHGNWYIAPNGENYAATLRPLTPNTWLAKKLSEELSQRDGQRAPAAQNVPTEDAVSVVGDADS